mmetsp:Transcript_58042/g.149407  ORF Transcript_58042/g.149407 Transcript_58042/m.149407 type:complete len:241 (-) Transcript_58042:151-873(-)
MGTEESVPSDPRQVFHHDVSRGQEPSRGASMGHGGRGSPSCAGPCRCRGLSARRLELWRHHLGLLQPLDLRHGAVHRWGLGRAVRAGAEVPGGDAVDHPRGPAVAEEGVAGADPACRQGRPAPGHVHAATRRHGRHRARRHRGHLQVEAWPRRALHRQEAWSHAHLPRGGCPGHGRLVLGHARAFPCRDGPLRPDGAGVAQAEGVPLPLPWPLGLAGAKAGSAHYVPTRRVLREDGGAQR